MQRLRIIIKHLRPISDIIFCRSLFGIEQLHKIIILNILYTSNRPSSGRYASRPKTSSMLPLGLKFTAKRREDFANKEVLILYLFEKSYLKLHKKSGG